MVRVATQADVGVLAGLRYEFRAALGDTTESSEEFVARCGDWMRRALAPDGGWRCWVAVADDGALVGMIWLRLLDKLPNPVGEAEWHGYVSSLYVQPDRRGLGLGSALLRASLDTCRHAGCDRVILWPTPRSRSLYERHGFAPGADVWARRG